MPIAKATNHDPVLLNKLLSQMNPMPTNAHPHTRIKAVDMSQSLSVCLIWYASRDGKLEQLIH